MRTLLNAILAIVSGVLFAWSFPNVAAGWLMFIALVSLFVALSRTSSYKGAFALGWLSQGVAWLLMVPWVIRVMSHYGGLPYITGILLFIAMCAYLGMYGGLFALLFHRIAPGMRFRRWLFVPLTWAVVEYIRTYLFSGFPWSLIAASIIDYTPLVQFDRVAGPYALGVLILLPSALIAWLIVRGVGSGAWGVGEMDGVSGVGGRGSETEMSATLLSPTPDTRVSHTQPPTPHTPIFAIAAVAIVTFVWWTTGYVAEKVIARPTAAPIARAALLQPNISQEMRWDNDNLVLIFRRMMAMTDEATSHGVQVVIWPESTVPLSYATTDFYRQAIEDTSRAHGADIILGSVAEDAAQPEKLWNAAFLVSGGRTIGHYDKIRLVPFGEYVPMRKMLFFAHKLVHAVGQFEFGTKDTPLDGLFRYGPAICYEVVFPQIPRTQVVHGANVLITITNDAWYDGTSAPRQHLNQARLRAIENDRYLLRAGTTGISAVIDPTGRIVQELAMGKQGIIYADFQPRTSVTPYVHYGDWFAWAAMVAVVVGMVRRKRSGLVD
ncbi:MAG TPA: apolipoprotein N-acyltransferase [Thermoanaerobaculia bacterium]|nr:apolipoprotein N-acyltransferase [Thermoanaerobaculia bacterium]